MMECLEAQDLVSAALDGEVADAAELERAKDHCRACPECAAYVRALVQVRRAATPEPPADLADRIMARVRTEAARTEGAVRLEATGNATDVLTLEAPVRPAPSNAEVSRRLVDRLTDPRNRRAVIAWTAAAAVVFIAAGFGAVAGVRTILSPRVATEGEFTFDAGTTEQLAVTPPTAAAPGASSAAPEADRSLAAPSSGLIVVDGAVYRSTGVDGSVTKAELSPQGSVDTALDTGGSPLRRTVYGTGEAARLFLELDDGTMLGFDRVTTTFAGRTYVLRSGAITAFGEPVTLPSDVPEPSSSDGSPVFSIAEEGLEPPVYVRAGSDPEQGIALPPGARTDVSASWTWWTPLGP